MGTKWTALLVVLLAVTLTLAIPRRELQEDGEGGRKENTEESTSPEPAEENKPKTRVTNETLGENELLTAVEKNNITAVKNLTSHGVNVNFNNGIPLNYAVTSSNLEMVSALIEAGADVNINQGMFLRNAAWGGHLDIVEAFVKAGAKKEYFGSALAEAANKGHSQIVKFLLDHGADPSNAESALKFAAENGNVETVRLLLTSGTSATSDETGGSPLFRAVMEGHSDVVALLVENGADVNKALTSNYWWDDVESSQGTSESYGNGWTVMHAAARFGQPLVEQLAGLGADINVKDVQGYTPLQVAIRHRKFTVALELLRFCADTTVKNDDGTEALDLAVQAAAQNATNSTRVQSLMDKMSAELSDEIASAPFTDQGIEELKNAFERRLSRDDVLKSQVKDLITDAKDIVTAAEKVLELKAGKEVVKVLEERNCTPAQIERAEAKCKCTPPVQRTSPTVRENEPTARNETTSSTSSTSTSTGTSTSTSTTTTTTTTTVKPSSES